MSQLIQAALPLGIANTIEQHIKVHRTDAGFVERKPDRKKTCKPTEFLPGTPGKVAVLEQRLRNGEPLWHPQDAKLKRKRAGWESSDVPL